MKCNIGPLTAASVWWTQLGPKAILHVAMLQHAPATNHAKLTCTDSGSADASSLKKKVAELARDFSSSFSRFLKYVTIFERFLGAAKVGWAASVTSQIAGILVHNNAADVTAPKRYLHTHTEFFDSVVGWTLPFKFFMVVLHPWIPHPVCEPNTVPSARWLSPCSSLTL